MQKAIVSGAAKALGQNMLQYQPQEVFALEATVAGFAGTAFDVLKGDTAVLVGDDIIFADDASV